MPEQNNIPVKYAFLTNGMSIDDLGNKAENGTIYIQEDNEEIYLKPPIEIEGKKYIRLSGRLKDSVVKSYKIDNTITANYVNGEDYSELIFNLKDLPSPDIIGKTASLQIDSDNYDFVGIVKETNDYQVVITVTDGQYLNFDSNKTFDDGYLWFPNNPELGNVNLIIKEASSAFQAGNNNIASQANSIAFGEENRASGQYSFVAGQKNSVGYASAAFGSNNTIRGNCGLGCGDSNDITTSTKNSVIFGKENKINGNNTLVYGEYNLVNGISSVVGGENNKISFNIDSDVPVIKEFIDPGYTKNCQIKLNNIYGYCNKILLPLGGKYYGEHEENDIEGSIIGANSVFGIGNVLSQYGNANYVGGVQNKLSECYSANFVFGTENKVVGDGNIVFGLENIMTEENYDYYVGDNTCLNMLFGTNNQIETSQQNVIFGYDNVITEKGFRNMLFGGTNLALEEAEQNFVLGYENIITGTDFNMLFGFANDVFEGAEYNFIFGSNNIVNNKSSVNTILGNGNRLLESSHNIVLGQENNILQSNNNIIFGNSNTSNGNTIYGFGQGLEIKQGNSMVIGFYNDSSKVYALSKDYYPVFAVGGGKDSNNRKNLLEFYNHQDNDTSLFFLNKYENTEKQEDDHFLNEIVVRGDIKDFIVEQVINKNGWSYTKRSSGLVEAWIDVRNIPSNPTASTSHVFKTLYPFDITDAVYNVTAVKFGWAHTKPMYIEKHTDGINIRYYFDAENGKASDGTPLTQCEFSFDVNIKGYWK